MKSAITKIIHQKSLLYFFSKNSHPISHNRILKNYFNNRMDLSSINMVEILEQLDKSGPRYQLLKDHRYVHLVIHMQKNIHKFEVKEKLRIAKALTKLNNCDQLFKMVIDDLCLNLKSISLDELATVFYILGKSKKSNVQILKKLCDHLASKLQGKQQQKPTLIYDKQKNKRVKSEESNISNSSISCKKLVLVLWSLHQMKITDKILTDLILKQFIRPNISQFQTQTLPLLLSVLSEYNLENKRIFSEVIETLNVQARKVDLQKLDIEQLKISICAICKSVYVDKQLVLWLFETMMIKLENHKNPDQVFTSGNAYQVLFNLVEANVFDELSCQFLINKTIENFTELEPKHLIKLLLITQKLGKQKFKDQKNAIAQYIWPKFNFIINRFAEDHPLRRSFRNMVLKNKSQAPKGVVKFFTMEDRWLRVQKNSQKVANNGHNSHNSKQYKPIQNKKNNKVSV